MTTHEIILTNVHEELVASHVKCSCLPFTNPTLLVTLPHRYSIQVLIVDQEICCVLSSQAMALDSQWRRFNLADADAIPSLIKFIIRCKARLHRIKARERTRVTAANWAMLSTICRYKHMV